MDLSKLKKRPSHPFETIAVAVSFSSRCQSILNESNRIATTLKANLILLHIGDRTKEKEVQLDELMNTAGIHANACRVIWMDGDPVETILELCKLNIVDLLILGALEKENLFKFYMGSIARNISRKAKCSVLLLTHPSATEKKVKKIIVNGVENPKTIHTINTALYIAKNFKVKEVTIVNEVHLIGLAMTLADDSTAPETRELKKNISEQADDKLQSLIDTCENDNVILKEKSVKGKPGYTISKYARDKKADLLVINSPDTSLNVFDRIFTHDIEFVLADLPCNLLIVHSRIA